MIAVVCLTNCNVYNADFAVRVTLTRHIKTDYDCDCNMFFYFYFIYYHDLFLFPGPLASGTLQYIDQSNTLLQCNQYYNLFRCYFLFCQSAPDEKSIELAHLRAGGRYVNYKVQELIYQ